MNLSEWSDHLGLLVGALSQRLWAAEQALDQITKLHGPDPTGSWCGHCQNPWPCATRTLATTTERKHPQ